MILTIDELKKKCTMIHAFGLGFIQIKMGEVERVHVYCKEAGLTTKDEEVHNHRYDFESVVLKGRLNNKLYSVQENTQGNYLLVNESCNPNMPKDEKVIRINKPELITEFNTENNQKYFLNKDSFHQVKAEQGTITFVKRGPVVKPQAQVIYKEGDILTCPFSLKLKENDLWEIVKEYL